MSCFVRNPLLWFGLLITLLIGCMAAAQAAPPAPSLFARDNLVAWCIVPFDGHDGGPPPKYRTYTPP